MDTHGTQTTVTKELLDEGDMQILNEVAQLKRTLDVRTAEITLAVERTKLIETKTEEIRNASLTVSAKRDELLQLEEALRIKEETNAELKKEIERTRDDIVLVHRERSALRHQRKKMADQLKPLLDDLVVYTTSQQLQEKKLKPEVAVSSLLAMMNESIAVFEKSVATYVEADKILEQKTERVQEVHRTCLAEVNAAAAEKELQKEQLEHAWQREQKKMKEELKSVTARAHEAAYHQRRGTSSSAGTEIHNGPAKGHQKQHQSADADSMYVRDLRSEIAVLQRDLQTYQNVQRSEAYAAARERQEILGRADY